jgi:hypothetical protein
MWWSIREKSLCGLSKISGPYQAVATRHLDHDFCNALFNAVATVVIDCGSYVKFKVVAAFVEKIFSFGM